MVRLIVFLCAVAAYSQTSTPKPEAGGLEPAWDIAVILQEISGNAARLLPALDKIDAHAWVAKGASETYAEQVEMSRDQAKALAEGASTLAKNPEKLSASLELFFRMEGLTTLLSSVEEGARKYQGTQAAQALMSTYAEGGANRERFREYIVNLAAQRERQFDVMDREAQRCRGTLMAPSPAKTTTGRKK
jgi:prophage DNA circulation protein